MPLRRVVCWFWVRAVRSTLVVDRGFMFFDRLRAKAVLACASDAFYDSHNDVTYARQGQYRAGSEAFRSSLFPFEENVIARTFHRRRGQCSLEPQEVAARRLR
jgi:hypothetical protein